MNNYSVSKALLIYAFLMLSVAVISVTAVLVMSYEEPERLHRHKQVYVASVGIYTYYVTYCYDTKMQVDAHGNHDVTKRSTKYFNTKDER